jgi:hypothetical protein
MKWLLGTFSQGRFKGININEILERLEDELLEGDRNVIDRIAPHSGRNWSRRSPPCRPRPRVWRKKHRSWRGRCRFDARECSLF